MGLRFYVILNKPSPEEEGLSIAGKTIASVFAELDALAVKRGITPLSSFIPISDDDVQFTGKLGIKSEATSRTKWFEPSEGLKSVRSLIREIQATNNLLQNARDLLTSLEKIELYLIRASTQKSLFCFELQ